ncbi:hypothetical protein [Microbacterium sp. CFBP9034]|uniref:hypothetical protein n=1 Tax=Microbacterium sp. CFBP9034 TaxID=3096540 RepID=UPI002A6A6083|nr:hypothetical protein [Microbacterium sp. CFBP9034]MDY0908419.1 hypothetical protein [Microbacterium sp. CFBP9034]
MFKTTARTPADQSRWLRRGDLLEEGWTPGRIRKAVAGDLLLRPREGVYLPSDAPGDVVDACRVGGRLGCVSALAHHGIFVMTATALHVQLPPNASRLREVARPLRLHWERLLRSPHPQAVAIEVFDALVQGVRCQSPRASVATIDSALHLGLLRRDELEELFDALPRRYSRLRPLLDSRSESGPESLMRLILRALGVPFEVQVRVPGVGRVDFLVAGWLIIECDSREHHADWESQRRDRRRDLAAARSGLVTFRVIAEDILWHPDEVRAALACLVRSRRAAGDRTGFRKHAVALG